MFIITSPWAELLLLLLLLFRRQIMARRLWLLLIRTPRTRKRRCKLVRGCKGYVLARKKGFFTREGAEAEAASLRNAGFPAGTRFKVALRMLGRKKR